MEAAVAVAIIFLPAIIYLVRTPHRLDHADVAMSLLAVWLGLTIATHLLKWLLSDTAALWSLGLVSLAMVIYAWVVTSKDRRASKGKADA
jgi:hypothetical protein